MVEERAQRRLAAILAADVVGYSRLMDQGEAGTFERLRACRKELIEPEIAQHQGRVFKLMGDGLLAEFASVVEAVECAAVVQHAMAERNAGVAGDRRIDLRIGINLGDVIIEGEDRHGDGVNIAARLQQLAEPGGVAASRTIVDHVRHKLPLCFESLGEQRVKNITEPVGVYRLAAERPARRLPFCALLMRFGRPRARFAAAAILLLAAGAGAAAWYLNTRDHQPIHCLSIVVLPFTTLGTDPEQNYFADAITNDLNFASFVEKLRHQARPVQ
jgi:adenylate cyclase